MIYSPYMVHECILLFKYRSEKINDEFFTYNINTCKGTPIFPINRLVKTSKDHEKEKSCVYQGTQYYLVYYS